MSDRIATQIEIGGLFKTPSDLQAVARAADREGLSHAWGDRALDHDDVVEVFFEAEQQHSVTFLYDDQSRTGAFEELEQACRGAGVCFKRHAEAKYESDGELVWWRPGMDKPAVCVASQGGRVMLPLARVQAAWRNGSLQQLLDACSPISVPPVAMAFSREQWHAFHDKLDSTGGRQ